VRRRKKLVLAGTDALVVAGPAHLRFLRTR